MSSRPVDVLPPLMATFLALSIITVGLRIYTRAFISKSLGYDDYCMLVALVGFIMLCSFAYISLGYGYGRFLEPNPNFDMLKGAMYFVICQLTYMVTVVIAKISAALVLYRLASDNSKNIRRFLVGLMAVFLFSMSGLIIAVGLQCRPLSVSWGEGKGECMSGNTIAQIGYAFSSIDMTVSWVFAVLPAYMIWKVQMSWKLKITVIILLGMSVTSCAATIVRLKYLAVDLARLPSGAALETADIYLTTFVYTILETGLTIVTASLAAVRPLLKLIPGFLSTNNYGSSEKKVTNRSGDADKAFAAAGGRHLGSSNAQAIRLEDMSHTGTASSQESILAPTNKRGIQKKTEYEVKYQV